MTAPFAGKDKVNISDFVRFTVYLIQFNTRRILLHTFLERCMQGEL